MQSAPLGAASDSVTFLKTTVAPPVKQIQPRATFAILDRSYGAGADFEFGSMKISLLRSLRKNYADEFPFHGRARFLACVVRR